MYKELLFVSKAYGTQLEEIRHEYLSQGNEAKNNKMMRYAPKHLHYSKTYTFFDRVA